MRNHNGFVRGDVNPFMARVTRSHGRVILEDMGTRAPRPLDMIFSKEEAYRVAAAIVRMADESSVAGELYERMHPPSWERPITPATMMTVKVHRSDRPDDPT